ncbi:MAG: hypothetical protein GAK35_00518 [Herbaspirillum frisingense]|uniref:Pilus assembly protein PilM n=1 Tax=Herbaspirillum frisingense TaxID=92645 RepID=A0A7V8FZV4_9BURK|nr:MAG: hypothetical protein GAK35_00518 [Herbaspirillum frisingense]
MTFIPSLPRWPHARLVSPAQACIGLDIAGDRARLALMRRRRVERLAEQVFGAPVCEAGQIGDFALLAQGCREWLGRLRIEGAAIAMAVPAACITTTRLILPASSGEAQRLAQIRAELAAHGLPPDDIALDYRVLGPAAGSPDDVDILVLSAPVMVVEDRLELAESLGLRVQAMAPEDICLAGFLRGAQPTADAAVLHLGAGGSWLSLPPAERLPLQWQPASGSLPALLGELAPWLQRSSRRLLLTGDHHELPAVAAALSKYADIAAAVAALPAAFADLGTLPADASDRRLPAFHCALALAATGAA